MIVYFFFYFHLTSAPISGLDIWERGQSECEFVLQWYWWYLCYSNCDVKAMVAVGKKFMSINRNEPMVSQDEDENGEDDKGKAHRELAELAVGK